MEIGSLSASRPMGSPIGRPPDAVAFMTPLHLFALAETGPPTRRLRRLAAQTKGPKSELAGRAKSSRFGAHIPRV